MKNQHYEEEMLKLSKAQSKKYWEKQQKMNDTLFQPASWYVIKDDDGRIYVSDPSQNCVAEFETEEDAWEYIFKCRDYGVDF